VKLIIAEKPSLARNIVAGIGRMDKKDGYFINDEYIVSWAFGHLFSLADIESYSGMASGSAWTLDNLPCFPEKFRFELKKGSNKRVDPGVKKQFGIIEALVNRDDVDTIVNAGDADREGEIIVRLCISNSLKTEKRLMRLWLPDQTPETVRGALSDMKDESAYDNLAEEGFARTYIDWLYGVNLTRYATILSGGKLLRVGRVIVPIVKAIYDRDLEIRNFKPEKYFSVASSAKTRGEKVELTSRAKFSSDERERAEQLAALYNDTGAVVTSVESKKDSIFPGKLYSLSTLQSFLGKKYKMSMAESLNIIQKLYEEGYLTYPRTNSEYLASAEKDKIKKIIANCKKLGYGVVFKDKKTIFDDSKIESHSAITPTYKIPDKNKLSEREMQVYSTVMRRFAAVFCEEECLAQKVEITVSVGELEEFVLKGLTIVQKGWMKYDDGGKKDKVLPALSKGDKVNICFKPVEKETTPPKHYTIETLNNYLKNPFREEKDSVDDTMNADDAEEYRAMFEGIELGTEATRTGIIDNARKSGYIKLTKDVYTILPGGEFLVESLDKMKINMDKFKTSEMGRALKRVYRGEMTIDETVDMAKNEISGYFMREGTSIEDSTDTGFFGDEIGKCPLCGGTVKRYRYNYGCDQYKEGCKFTIPTYLCGRAVSLSNAKMLLTEGRSSKIKGFISKKGTLFDSCLEIKEGRCVFNFNL